MHLLRHIEVALIEAIDVYCEKGSNSITLLLKS